METEHAWAAGVFEGRGTFVTKARGRMQVKSTDAALVDRFSAAVEVGKVYGPYGPYKQNGDSFVMWVAERSEAWAAFDCMDAYLSPATRERFLEVFGE